MRFLLPLLMLLAAPVLGQPGGAPSALIDGLGMRLYESDHVEPFLDLTVEGERVWLATGWTDSKVKSRTLYVAPNNAGGIAAHYLRRDGTTSPLPVLGGSLARPMIFNHEGTAIGGTPDLMLFLTYDGLDQPGYSYVRDTAREPPVFEVVRREGERWGNGAKNMAAAVTPSGELAVLHSAAEPGGWPNLLASTDRGRDFAVPETRGRTGQMVLRLQLLPVRRADGSEVVYVYWIIIGKDRHPLWGEVEVRGGVPTVRVLADDYAAFYPSDALERLPNGGIAGPQPRWLGAWKGGILLDTANRGLWLWREGRGRARLVENVYGDRTRDSRYFESAGQVYRLGPSGALHRLEAVDDETSAPTWTHVSTITFPDASWTERGAPVVRGTPEGALWVYGRTPQTHPDTGRTVPDHALAYWAPGTALPATHTP